MIKLERWGHAVIWLSGPSISLYVYYIMYKIKFVTYNGPIKWLSAEAALENQTKQTLAVS